MAAPQNSISLAAIRYLLMRTALLVGAGFSRWAANIPVASELFDFGIAIWPGDLSRLSLLFTEKQLWDISHPEGAAEVFIADVLGSGSGAAREALLWYIGRRLTEPLIRFERSFRRERRRTLAIGEPFAAKLPGVRNARQYLSALRAEGDLVGVVTTNYDLLIEYALGPKGFFYGQKGETLEGYRSPFRKAPVTLSGDILLAKLHGSLSWDDRRKYSDARRAITGRALIVAPTPEKVPPRSLAEIWKSAARIVTDAERLIVFGFSFNPYDAAVLSVLRDAGAGLTQVEVVDLVSRRTSAAELWPTAEIRERQPPDRVTEPSPVPDFNTSFEAARAACSAARSTIDEAQVTLFDT